MGIFVLLFFFLLEEGELVFFLFCVDVGDFRDGILLGRIFELLVGIFWDLEVVGCFLVIIYFYKFLKFFLNFFDIIRKMRGFVEEMENIRIWDRVIKFCGGVGFLVFTCYIYS